MKKQEFTFEKQLRALYKLQLIDSRIDEIRDYRVSLPLEVKKIENEIKVLIQKIENINNEINLLSQNINKKNKNIKEAEDIIKKYHVHKINVNNREYEFLNKEIEYQELVIELSLKEIKEYKLKINNNNIYIQELEVIIKNHNDNLFKKKEILNQIFLESKKQEKFLLEKKELCSKQIEDNLLQTYKKIRNNVEYGLAVVPVERGVAVGSFLFIPLQTYSELFQRKKIIIDEHSGRILIDNELAEKERKIVENEIFSRYNS
ncbi:MAG: hypothetical protein NHF98_01810 [Candidatus Bostrichicola ureolyticus]|nr:MAG: hypothetical protein NHF98_01810 [Candidatus Bostrichicola ureolyticus]